MASWQVLDLTNHVGKVKTMRGGLMVREQRIAIEPLSQIIVGAKTSLGAGVLNLCARYQVMVQHVDWRGVPYSITFPFGNNTRVGARHIAQHNMSLPRTKSAWKQIVIGKVLGQSANFTQRGLKEEALFLQNLSNKVLSGDTANIEGQAAAYYWPHFMWKDFKRDIDGEDFHNGALNYGYTILRGYTIKAICSAGLWPTLGLHHKNRANVFALADDLMEPFRPVIDSVVVELDETLGMEDANIRKKLVNVLSKTFNNETGATGITELNSFVQNFAQHIEGNKKLKVPIWQGN
ncbi:MAG: type II CRISPR-associated endonuclease Cas1 [Micrococcaceae bacterium]